MIEQPRKIAILGGGLGGISTAFELTSRPQWWKDYEITIYQLGWRLGGKGASGRNAAVHQRIEEHGLHIFFGFYHHAMRMMRRCYGELNRSSDVPISSFDQAFKKHSQITFMEKLEGQWNQTKVNLPTNDEQPGLGDNELPSAWTMLKTFTGMMRLELQETAASSMEQEKKLFASSLRSAWKTFFRAAPKGDDSAHERHLSDGLLARPLEMAMRLAQALPEDAGLHRPEQHRALIRVIDSVRVFLRARHQLFTPSHHAMRWQSLFTDFGTTLVRGVLSDGVLIDPRGFRSLDEEEFSDWCRRHGMSESTLRSPLVRGFYNAAFCYEDGDTDRPNMAAGTMIQTILLMSTAYKGAFMWKMQGGMGDTIFAPLYEVLRKRGDDADEASGREGCLRFKFFHRVDALRTSGPTQTIEQIEVTRQATIKAGKEYAPLTYPQKLPSWPNEPIFSQLEEGEVLRAGPQDKDRGEGEHRPFNLESAWTSWRGAESLVLKRGEDFDDVVLALSLGPLPHVCADLVKENQRWSKMVENVKTCRTQAFQVWLHPSVKELGWSASERAVMDGYYDPMNSWADMSQVLVHETWPLSIAPETVAYFCGPMREDGAEPDKSVADDDYEETQNRRVRDTAHSWFHAHMTRLLPGLAQDDHPRPDIDLVVAENEDGERKFNAQFFRANIDPSERYVLSVAKSSKYRIPSGDSGYENMVLAGDWTENGLNLGCAEAATKSGVEAAQALLARLKPPKRGESIAPKPRSAVPRSAEPKYIEYGGLQVLSPPYKLEGVSARVLPIKANPEKLQSAVDRLLNPAARDGVRFYALGDLLLVQLGYIDRNSSIRGPDRHLGYGSETSATISIPVVRGEMRQGTFVPIDLGVFVAYIFVDNTLSLASGREVYGYPKELGFFSHTGASYEPDSSVVETMAWTRHGNQAKLTRTKVLEVRHSGRAGPTKWNSTTELMGSLLSVVLGREGVLRHGLSMSLLKSMAKAELSMFNVRQIRSLEDPTIALHQSVTRSVFSVSAIEGSGLIEGDHLVELFSYPSHPFADDFGIDPGAQRALSPVWVKFDAILDTKR